MTDLALMGWAPVAAVAGIALAAGAASAPNTRLWSSNNPPSAEEADAQHLAPRHGQAQGHARINLRARG